jgi:hypothetical protein
MASKALLVNELNRLGRRAEKATSLSAKEFNAAIDEYVEEILPEQFVTFHRWVAMELLRRVVMKTPVDTGRARGNWQITIDTPADGETDVADRRGGRTVDAEGAKLGRVYFGCVVWLTNNVAYIISLEGGWSDQAPAGMLALSLQEISVSLRRVA